MSKQLRIDFPDYPPEEQKSDVIKAERNQSTDVYVMRVNGDWGAVMPRKRHNVIFNADKGVELPEFYSRKCFTETKAVEGMNCQDFLDNSLAAE